MMKDLGDGGDNYDNFKMQADDRQSQSNAQTKRNTDDGNNNAVNGNNGNQQQWDILWFDHGGLTPEFLSSMLPWQRVNHFLGMYNISRKNTLGIHLKRFLKEFPKEYNFFPNTWLYPSDFFEINEYYNTKLAKRKQKLKEGKLTENQVAHSPVVLFICKPEASCQGKGIFIVKRLDDMRQQLNSQLQAQQKQFKEYIQAQEYYETALFYSQKPNLNQSTLNSSQQQQFFSVNQDQSVQQPQQAPSNYPEPPQYVEKNNTYVIQKYLKNPALIDGHKFDFRIYVLITSVIEPLTIFLYQDGLVRLASEKYQLSRNIQDHYIHLTNYSLNKKNTNFNGEKHKLKLSECLNRGLTQSSEKGVFTKNKDQIWKEIEDIVIKTVITIQPQLQHYYRSSQPKEPDLCYELLGFDIILDNKLKPWLLEVNHLPSFNSDTPSDEQVKFELIRDAFTILQLSVDHRKKVQKEMKSDQAKQSQQQGCYKRLTVKEHVDRVRFDPTIVQKCNPQNKFKLIFPQTGGDTSQYDKYQRKANEIWQMTTGTFRQQQVQQQSLTQQKKKKLIKSRHRKQSQQLQLQQTTADQTTEMLSEKADTRKASDQEPYDSNIGPEDLNRRLMQINSNYENAKTITSSTEQEQLNLLNDKRQTTTNQQQNQQTFFEKRQSQNPKVQSNQSQIQQYSAKIQKQNSSRHQLKSNIRQAQSNPRGNPPKQPQSAFSIKQPKQNQSNSLVQSSSMIVQKEDLGNDDKISNKEEPRIIDGDPTSRQDIDLDLLQKLNQNNGQLKYKEYCKALIDDFNHAYYKSSYQVNNTFQTNPNQQDNSNSRSISNGITLINSNPQTLVNSSQPVAQNNPSYNIYNATTSNLGAFYNSNFGVGSNHFLKKLKNVIHSQQGRHNGIIGRSNRQGMLIGNLVSPGTLQRKNYNKSNPFQQSIIKSKEDLAIYNMAVNQRVLLRSDSIQNKGGVIDMAPINMSAGVIDFKVQYKKHMKRPNPNAISSQNSNQQRENQSKVLSKSVNNQIKQQSSMVNPRIKLQWVNDSSDLVNFATNEDQYLGSFINYRSKREQKNSRILSIENSSNIDKNLDRLKEYEKKLLSNASYHKQQ